MKNLHHSLHIPKPSQYVSHNKVDEIATELARAYRQNGDAQNDTLGVENFVSNVLEKNVFWRPIPEPENRICFASIDHDRIKLNENHRPLFDAKPFLLRSCLSHEIGHEILGHLELLRSNANQVSLFDVTPTSEFVFHDSAWRQFDLTREEIVRVKNELAKTAWMNEQDREVLRMLADRLEPEWMYYQAEHFAACFLIPRDRLFEQLETGIDITKWPTLYSLRDRFGVSISMMCVRLEKLKLIEIKNKQIILVPQVANLF